MSHLTCLPGPHDVYKSCSVTCIFFFNYPADLSGTNVIHSPKSTHYNYAVGTLEFVNCEFLKSLMFNHGLQHHLCSLKITQETVWVAYV